MCIYIYIYIHIHVSVTEERAAFSYDLLCELREQHADCEFVFVIGSGIHDNGISSSNGSSRSSSSSSMDCEFVFVIGSGHCEIVRKEHKL